MTWLRARRLLTETVVVALVAGVVCAAVVLAYVHRQPDFFVVNDARDEFLPKGYEVARLVADRQWPVFTTRVLSGGNLLASFGSGPLDAFNTAVWSLWGVLGTPRRVGMAMVGALAMSMYGAGYLLTRGGLGVRKVQGHLAGTLMVTAPMFLVFALPGWWNNALGVAAFTWAVAALLLVWRRPTAPRMVFLGLTTWGVFSSGWPQTFAAFAVVCVVVGLRALTAGGSITARERCSALWPLATPVLFGTLAAWPNISEFLAMGGYLARQSTINNAENFLVPTVNTMLGVASPVGGDFVPAWGGFVYLAIPFGFATILVLVACCFTAHSWSLVRRDRNLHVLLASAFIFYVMTQLPTRLGPTRWPIRFLSYAIVLVIAATIHYLARTPRAWSARRFLVATGAVALGSLYASWRVPDPAADRFLSLYVPLLGLLAIACLLGLYRFRRLRLALDVALVVVGVVLVWSLSPSWFNPGTALAAPESTRRVAELAQGGFVLDLDPARDGWAPGLSSSRYLMSGISIINGYDPVGHAGFSRLARPRVQGYLEPGAADRFTAEPPGWPGTCWTDAMRVSMVITSADATKGRHAMLTACGFRMVGKEGNAAAFVHERPAEDARSTVSVADAGITWSHDVLETERTERLHVVNASADPGRLVFARLTWPGYTATLDGAPLKVTSLDGVLVQVEIPGHAGGDLVLHYTPRTWRVQAPAAFLLGLGGTAISAILVARRKAWRHATAREVEGVAEMPRL